MYFCLTFVICRRLIPIVPADKSAKERAGQSEWNLKHRQPNGVSGGAETDIRQCIGCGGVREAMAPSVTGTDQLELNCMCAGKQ